MRFKKSVVILIVASMLLAAGFIYFNTQLLEKIKQTTQEQGGGSIPAKQMDGANTASGVDTSVGSDSYGDTLRAASENESSNHLEREIRVSENVPVNFNTAEYDMEVNLCQDSENRTLLRLKYYIEGESLVKDIYEEEITELTNIFENRERVLKDIVELQDAKTTGSVNIETDRQEQYAEPYTIAQLLLNPVYGQLYFLINGEQINSYTQSSFYVINLYDYSVKKLFSYSARYGKISFSSNFELLAYDFEDPPHMSIYPEESIIEVYSCTDEKFIIKGSRKSDQSPIGLDVGPGYIIDYMFMGWQGPDTVRLNCISRLNGDRLAEPVFIEVMYDVISDVMLKSDGSELSKTDFSQESDLNGTGDDIEEMDTEADEKDADNEEIQNKLVDQLKSFYSYLGSENDYEKAMKLLDDDFILKLEMLRQFGIYEIHKRDIDAEYGQGNVSMYSELLKAARFESLVSTEIVDDDQAKITYYQSLELSGDSNVGQLMSAILVKRDNDWMIKLIEDGNL